MCAHKNKQMDSILFFLPQNYRIAPNFCGNIFINFVINKNSIPEIGGHEVAHIVRSLKNGQGNFNLENLK